MFDRNDWAPPAMIGHCPLPTTPEGCNEVFNRVAMQFRKAFGFAASGRQDLHRHESPLALPRALQERIKAQGKDPNDPATVREVYEGTFRRIAASHPLDYYWIWTPEIWTWNGNTLEQYKATVADIEAGLPVARERGGIL